MSRPMAEWMGSGGSIGMGIAFAVISARDLALANDKKNGLSVASYQGVRRLCGSIGDYKPEGEWCTPVLVFLNAYDIIQQNSR